MTKIAIMQPTYLPWCGYFALIKSVDTFVFLDSVQFARRSWQQRNKIKSNSGEIWLSIPVRQKGKRAQLINEVKINSEGDFPKKHIKSIDFNYCKANYFQEESKIIYKYLEENNGYLADLNISLIKAICNRLNISTNLICSSDLKVAGTKDVLLASICQQLNATEYFSAPGSKEYLDQSQEFRNRRIDITYFQYDHPIYSQLHNDFVPYMSIIDMLFNHGKNSLDIINSGFK
tara:strand:+ start:349 stop:1044 length:696 start_codon:yes stop_codon:yes gene_type:complete